RKRIIALHSHPGWSIQHISEALGCSRQTVFRILAIHRDCDQLSRPSFRTRGRPRILSRDNHDFIKGLLDSHCGLYLDEVQDYLWEERGT
ncbi:hypothetical protein WOLCODRAFT_31542, partial [Wolfiporia cocos MD-104 SS10]